MSQWSRGLFVRKVVHLPVWCTALQELYGVQFVEAVCGRYVRVGAYESSGTRRCLDCVNAHREESDAPDSPV